MPIRLRVTLLFAGTMALVLAATGGFVAVRVQTDLRAATDDALRARADAILATVGDRPAEIAALEGHEDFAQMLGAEGDVLASAPSLDGRVLDAEAAGAIAGPTFLDAEVPLAGEDEPEDARLLAVPAPGGRVLVVGTSDEERLEAASALGRTLAVGGPAALALATLAVWLLAGVALRPVERMRVEAEAISVSETGRRLPVPETRDEIARLGASLNVMLERLEQAVERERRFVDDASHELRTPVTALRGELELALSRARDPEALAAALRRAAADADVLARLTEDLLVLARADRGRLPIRRERVDLAALAGQVTAGFRGRADEGGLAIDVRADGHAEVDPLRLRQVITNLLDNALRHTPRGGRVTLEAVAADGGVRLEVADTGPGFPAEVRSAPFEPFVRSGQERAASGGAGLGLAIVRAVVEAHGGSVELGDAEEGGARVRLLLPAA